MQKLFGLLGKNISYSFSRKYFTAKFEQENISNCNYINFDLDSLANFKDTILHHQNLKGMNVTIPYKESIFTHLDKVHHKAKRIGAVNTIKITKKGKLKGYNTDEYGFRKSIQPHLKPHHKKALILGTGGASKAIAFALEKMEIPYDFVSRSNQCQYNYENLTAEIINTHQIIINCTPLGTYPNIEACPSIPYKAITEQHLLYDLVYNPPITKFLAQGKENGATIVNGEQMLILQAEKSWRIWNK